MPIWSCSSLVTLRARRSVLPSGSNSSSRLSAPFLSWVHTSISSWQYANVQFSPYWHSCRSCTSAGDGIRTHQHLSDSSGFVLASFAFWCIPLQRTKAPRKLLRAGRGRILFHVGSSVFFKRHRRTSLLQRCAASG